LELLPLVVALSHAGSSWVREGAAGCAPTLAARLHYGAALLWGDGAGILGGEEAVAVYVVAVFGAGDLAVVEAALGDQGAGGCTGGYCLGEVFTLEDEGGLAVGVELLGLAVVEGDGDGLGHEVADDESALLAGLAAEACPEADGGDGGEQAEQAEEQGPEFVGHGRGYRVLAF